MVDQSRIGMHCRLIIYSYLDVREILDTVLFVSKRDRRELDNSGIVNRGKHWECSMFEHDYRYEIAHPYSISRYHDTVKKANYLYRYIEDISLNIDT